MEKKLEIGGQRNIPGWSEFGWDNGGKNIVFDTIDCPDNYLSEVYWSHVIEHIPYCNIESVVSKIYRKLEPGGKFRTLCPDLAKMIEAYNNNDTTQWDRSKNHWGSMATRGIYPILGVGGMLMAGVCGTEINPQRPETYVSDKDGNVYGTISHVAGWDYKMLENLLKHIGFTRIEKTDIESIDPHKGNGQLCVNAYK
tara:strand:+ start:425 stop:1015 length:591 start_codon:yes stop_codon:yes gene_type:complete